MKSYLNKVLIKVGVFQACHDKAIKKAIETSFTCFFWERHAEVCIYGNTEHDDGTLHARLGVAAGKRHEGVEPGWTT